MIDFTLSTPTQVIFGKSACDKLCETVRGYGFKRALLLYGGQSLKRSGLHDRLMRSLEEAGAAVCEMGGVRPNPTLAFAQEVAEFAAEQQVDLILAAGGGSVIDTAKYAANAVGSGLRVEDIFYKRAPITGRLPVGVVLTIAAAGSETSDSAVLTDEARHVKQGVSTEYNRPLFAVMDPTLTYTVSPYQTASGTVDILMHTMERYMRLDAGDHDLVDQVSEGLLRAVISAGRTALREPQNYDARATLMLAGSWSHNGLTGAGSRCNMSAHKLEHAMSALDARIAHGAGLAVVWPAYLTYIMNADLPRMAQYASRIWGVPAGDLEKMALEGIARTRAYFAELGMPQSLRETGLREEDIETMANLVTADGRNEIAALKPLAKADVMEIYRLCL